MRLSLPLLLVVHALAIVACSSNSTREDSSSSESNWLGESLFHRAPEIGDVVDGKSYCGGGGSDDWCSPGQRCFAPPVYDHGEHNYCRVPPKPITDHCGMTCPDGKWCVPVPSGDPNVDLLECRDICDASKPCPETQHCAPGNNFDVCREAGDEN